MLVCWLVAAIAAPPTNLVGSWSFTGGKAQAEAVSAKKEEIAQTFNFAIRPIVRSKLAKPMHVDEGIRIEASGDEVKVHYEGTYARTLTLEARGDGFIDAKGSLTLEPDGGAWLLKGVSDEGGLVRRFVPSGSTLTVESSLFSDQLEGTPSWTLTYTK